MSRVFVAEQVDLGRRVVVKVLPPEMAADVNIERFRREIQLAASLQHPHIVPLLAAGQSGDLLYYTMPFVEGESLRAKLAREGRLGVAEATRILGEVLGALSAAHASGVVHRDIKPENVLISHGQGMVTDFGVAKAVREAAQRTSLTSAGLAIGTPAYMAPEQALGDPALDHRCDLYAAGTLAYEMLTGGLPFAGTTPQAVLAAQLTAAPAPLAQRRPDVSPALADLVMKCLAREPAERWQTADELLLALQAAPTGSGAAPWPAPSRGALGKRPRALVLALIALVLAGAVGAWLLLRRGAPPVSPTAVAVFPFAVRGGADVAYLGEGMVNLLSTSLDGAGDLRSVDPRALLGLVHADRLTTPDPATGSRMAERLGAGLYVLGDIVQAGGTLRIQAALYDRRRGAEPVGSATTDGPPAEVFALVDRLAAQLLVSGGAGEASRVTRIAAVTTTSLPALKAYLEGEAEFRAGRYTAAMETFQRAVDADSDFALGYYRLSLAAEWGIRTDIAREAAAQAVRRAARLAEHDRTLLLALQQARSGATDDAERSYRSVIAAYPEDVEAWIQLGEVLFHTGPLEGRPLEDAREPELRVLAFEPDNPSAIVHLVRVEAAAGRAAAVDTLVRRFVRLNPTSDRVLEMEATRALALRDRAELQRVVGLLRRAPDALLPTALFGVNYSEDLVAGRPLIATMTDAARPPAVRAIGHVQLARLDLIDGHWAAALVELDSAEALDSAVGIEYRTLMDLTPFLPVSARTLAAARGRLLAWNAGTVAPNPDASGFVGAHNGVHPQLRTYLLGQVAVRMGDGAAAESYAASLDREPDTVLSRILFRPLARSVRAGVLERQGRFEPALRALGASDVSYEPGVFSAFFSRPLERYRRAQLLDTLGRYDEAVRWYRSFRALSLADRVFEAPAAYRQGRVLERLGRRAEARAAYERVALLWKDCDAELRPVLDDARARLARLSQ